MKSPDRARFIIEIGCACALLGVFLIDLKWFLIGVRTASHDNLNWDFPIFYHFFFSLSQYSLPVYNFFSRFGEPFVPIAAQIKLWDPLSTLFGLITWNAFSDKIQAFNMFRLAGVLFQICGMYVFFRPYCSHLLSRCVLQVTILLSSISIGSLRQDGLFNQMSWLPWLLILLRNSDLRRRQPILWTTLFSVLVGGTLQSYFFIVPTFFTISYLSLKYILQNDNPFRSLNKAHILLLAFLLLPTTGLNLYIYSQARDWILPERQLSIAQKGVPWFDLEQLNPSEIGDNSSWARIEVSGTAMTTWDYLQIFTERASLLVDKGLYSFGHPSEAPIVFGLAPLILGFVGLIFMSRRNKEDILWLQLLSLFVLFSLGKSGFVHRALVTILPVFGFLRHTHCLSIYVQFCFLYFVSRGAEMTLAWFDDKP